MSKGKSRRWSGKAGLEQSRRSRGLKLGPYYFNSFYFRGRSQQRSYLRKPEKATIPCVLRTLFSKVIDVKFRGAQSMACSSLSAGLPVCPGTTALEGRDGRGCRSHRPPKPAPPQARGSLHPQSRSQLQAWEDKPPRDKPRRRQPSAGGTNLPEVLRDSQSAM